MKGSISMTDVRVVFQTKLFRLMMAPCTEILEYTKTSDSLMFPYYSVKETNQLQVSQSVSSLKFRCPEELQKYTGSELQAVGN